MKKIFTILFLAFTVLLPVSGAENNALVAHYKFDEGEGNIAKDSSGNALHAKLIETTWEKFGVQGKAVRLDGTKKKAHIRLPLDKKLMLDKEMTLSIFFKVEKFDRRSSTLFSLGNYFLGWTSTISRRFVSFSSLVRGGKDRRNGGTCRTNVPVGTGTVLPFTNVVYTVAPDPANKGQNVLSIYVNGRKLSNKGVSNFPMRSPIRTSPKIPITIGNYTSNEGRWFNGIIDEVKIYNKALSAGEIAKNYQKTNIQPTDGPGETVILRKKEFKPLKNKKVALYTPLKVTKSQANLASSSSEGKNSPRHIAGWAKPIRKVEWFKEQAEKLGCKVTLIDDAKLTDKTFLTKKNFDTLIMPVNVMPVEAEDSVFQFLASGGNLITSTVVPSTYKRYADGTFGRFKGKSILKNHSYGWYSPYLIRKDPSRHGRRRWVAPLGLDPGVAEITGDLLPASIKNPSRRPLGYRPINKWAKVPGFEGSYGDSTNYALGADLLVEIYRERTGIGSGFAVYRYYNHLLFGSTLVNFGRVGNTLIAGKEGERYFKAAMYLLESKLPGEQKKEYYKNAVALHREWSDLGMTYTESVAALRDAAFYTCLCGKNWKNFTDKLSALEKDFSALTAERKTQKTLLVAAKKEADAATKKLLAKVRAASGKYLAYTREGKKAVASAKVPAKVPVKHKYGTIPSIASSAMPMTLSLYRGRLFDTMRRIGSNVFSGGVDTWYAEDPQVQKNMKGILRDHKFYRPAGPRVLVRGGRFNPANGTVKDAPAIKYPEEGISRGLKTLFDTWKWKRKEEFRIGTADETGIGLNFWGTQAKEELQKHLKKYYKNDVKAMNAHCGTSYKSFEEISVPVRKPETPAQHAIWEHFNKCREAYLEMIYGNFYRLVKKHNPNLDVFALPSTGGSALPLYGINYYNATKHQDVSGIDGTCGAINREWIYLDLTTKRYLTSEWGCLYQETSVQKVNAQMWQELTGGALGVEQHVWSVGDDSVNFADAVSCPTLYGAILNMALKDMRKLDHLILDGKRSVPEVGILYSQSSRIHDQGWGWAGGNTNSNHMLTVGYYYNFFLSWGRSARVYAAEALLEGKMPFVKVLIVPQAEFLSEKVQRALLAYVKKGGQLILEGRAGRFDEFGRKSDRIFREAGVIPVFSNAKKATMQGSTLGIQSSDNIYSPAGKGKVLASYDKDNAAILCNPYGKGSITFMGMGLGCYKYTAFAPVLEKILRNCSLDARFKVNSDKFVLREWEHGKDTYLLLSSRAGLAGSNWDVTEITMGIRGKVNVEDYLFGKEVKTSFRDGYTTFRTLAANGARVFRIKGKIAPAGKLAGKEEFKLANSSGAKDDVKKFTLPFKGNLYADTPLRSGKYTFSATVLGSGADNKSGDAFLTISGNGESQKKRMEAGRTVYFRMREKIYSVKCIRNFYMYPFYTVLEIKEVKALPPSGGAKISRKGKNITLSNDLLSLTFSRTGAKMISFLPLAEKEDIIKLRKGSVISGAAPGPFHNVDFLVKTANTKEGAIADFQLKEPIAQKMLTQKVTLAPDAAVCRMNFICTNKQVNTISLNVRYCPGLQLGGAADNADAFFVQMKDGSIQHIVFRGLNKGKRLRPSGNWAAVVDTKEKVAWINTLTHGNKEEMFYLWEATNFYNLELFSPTKMAAGGEKVSLDMEIMYMHGLTGISAVSKRNASYVRLADIVDQKKEFAPVLEVATACNIPAAASVTASLEKDGKKVLDFTKMTQKIAFDLPGSFTLKSTKNVKDLADGVYTLKIQILSANGNMSVTKEVTFAGRKIEKLSLESETLSQKIDSMGKKISSDKRFALLVKLGDLKRAISTNKLSDAEKLAEELKKECK